MRQLKISKTITIRESSSDKYFHEISKEGLITPEEEVELAQRIKKGDQKALEKLTKANLRFVVSVAKQYQHQGLSLPDLINEGNFGLIKAAKRFDETRGFRFISYAVWWIRQSILYALAEQAKIVRLPLNQIGSINKIIKAHASLEQEFERDPLLEEIAQILDLSLDKIKEALSVSGKHLSLDAPFSSTNEDSESSLLDILPSSSPSPDRGLMEKSLAKELERFFSILSEREKSIVKMFYGIGCPPMSPEDIGKYLEISDERVRQIKEKAIKRLRKTSKNVILKSYL